MKKIITKSVLLLFSSLILFSCSGDELETIRNAEYNAKMLDVFIYDSDLVGEWKVNALVTNKNVDLNGDGVQSDNLLLETSCFEPLVYSFKGNKTFTIVNPALELTQLNNKDEFNCQGATTISGKWSIKDDMLILYIKKNNIEYQERINLLIVEDSFYLEVNKDESKKFINDRGNSSVSGLSVVSLELKRTSKKV